MTEVTTRKAPMVSVFMPAYNQEHLIAESIVSVINQTYEDWELVIGDDCSSDRTYEIALEYQKQHPEKIKVYRNQNNLGITRNCNVLLKRCTGEYIAFTAGDDLWLPDKLQKQVALMESNSDCVLSYHDLEVFQSETGKLLYFWNTGPKRPRPIEGDSKYFLGKLVEFTGGFFGALSIMIRASALPQGAHYDDRLPHLSELSMWLDLLHNSGGVVRYIPQVLARYRKHKGGISNKNHDTEFDIFLAIVENKSPHLINSVRKARCRRYYTKGVCFFLNQEYGDAYACLAQSIRIGFVSLKVYYWALRAAVRI